MTLADVPRRRLALAALLATLAAGFTAAPARGARRPVARRSSAGTWSDTYDTGDWASSTDAAAARWRRVGEADVVVPADEDAALRGVVHFVGGALAGAAPRVTYGRLLEAVADRACVAVVATPLPSALPLDHGAAAEDAAAAFRRALKALGAEGQLDARRAPVFGIGHSLGAKVQCLIACGEAPGVSKRRAHASLAFNNYAASEAAPVVPSFAEAADALRGEGELTGVFADVAAGLRAAAPASLDLLTRGLDMADRAAPALGDRFADALEAFEIPTEFTPTPAETYDAIANDCNVGAHLVVQFSRDDIDQSEQLVGALRERFAGDAARLVRLPGTHLTPCTPAVGRDVQDRDDAVGSEARKAEVEFGALVETLVAWIEMY